jgi:hypothetical protein
MWIGPDPGRWSPLGELSGSATGGRQGQKHARRSSLFRHLDVFAKVLAIMMSNGGTVMEADVRNCLSST